MSLIVAKSIKKNFGTAQILRGISIELNSGEQYCIQGSSGSGKSTFLYLLGGLDRPTSGNLTIDGKGLEKLNDEELAVFRNRSVGFVFQFHFLLPSMNCMDNILLPAKIGAVPTKDVRKRSQELASLLKVEHCLNRFPYELSGGEQQRINIIRALSLRPKILLCDEPTGNLDSENSKLVARILSSLAKEFGSTLVVVTHDASVSCHFERILTMKDGLLQ